MSRRLILGQRNSGEWGLWLAKPGKDAFSTTASDFLINSDVASTPPLTSGLINSLPWVSSTAYVSPSVQRAATYQTTIAHNLGYIPALVLTSRWLGTPDISNSLAISLTTSNLIVSTFTYFTGTGSPASSVDLATILANNDGTALYTIFAIEAASG